MATAHSIDFYISYRDSCRNKTIKPDWDMLYRTHCGDIQFLHAMASKEFETASQTRDLMLMWAEYSYKVSTGKITTTMRFKNVSKYLEKYSGNLFNQYLTDYGRRRMNWDAKILFTQECDRNISAREYNRGKTADIVNLQNTALHITRNDTKYSLRFAVAYDTRLILG